MLVDVQLELVSLPDSGQAAELLLRAVSQREGDDEVHFAVPGPSRVD